MTTEEHAVQHQLTALWQDESGGFIASYRLSDERSDDIEICFHPPMWSEKSDVELWRDALVIALAMGEHCLFEFPEGVTVNDDGTVTFRFEKQDVGSVDLGDIPF